MIPEQHSNYQLSNYKPDQRQSVSSCSSIDKNMDEKKVSKFFRGAYEFPKQKYSLKEVKGSFHLDQ
jgi:hypothetical protein